MNHNDITTGIDRSTKIAQAGAHLSVVGGNNDTTIGRSRAVRAAIASTRFGSTIETPAQRSEASVRAIATEYATFEEALLPMVLASGVTGEAAVAVAAAVEANPVLRAQAERAWQKARMAAL
jgi:hypothetical protein